MEKPINLNEARELVKTYRAFTAEILTKRWNDFMENQEEELDDLSDAIPEILGTGFNEPNDTEKGCTLCKPVRTSGNCEGCLYQTGVNYSSYACANDEEHRLTFEGITDSENPQELYVAVQQRADHLESVINKWESGNFELTDNTRLLF